MDAEMIDADGGESVPADRAAGDEHDAAAAAGGPSGDTSDTSETSETAESAVETDLAQLTDELGEPVDLADVDVVALVAERDQFKDIALRLQADFENYRRRMAAQQHDEIDRATGKMAEGLLPVLDACEAAFSHGVDGVEPIWSALMGALQRQGLEAMDLQDKPFDPADAEAVLHEPGEGDGDPVVSEVLRTGYRWKGRVLRAAMVKVKG